MVQLRIIPICNPLFKVSYCILYLRLFKLGDVPEVQIRDPGVYFPRFLTKQIVIGSLILRLGISRL